MESRLKDDFLHGGTNGRLYVDGESEGMLYKVREVIPISRNQCGKSSHVCIVVQYEKGSARLPLDIHLEDPRLSDELADKLFQEGKFSDETFRSIIM